MFILNILNYFFTRRFTHCAWVSVGAFRPGFKIKHLENDHIWNQGNHYLIMVDYYSNFIEVAPSQHDTRTSTVVKHMKANIARYDIMDTLISDNGPQFACSEFKKFVNEYGINHVTSSPMHQQANGLAERAVQSMKKLDKEVFRYGWRHRSEFVRAQKHSTRQWAWIADAETDGTQGQNTCPNSERLTKAWFGAR